MKLFKLSASLIILSVCIQFTCKAANYAWPSKYEGVMLQGFYWDSYKGTNNSKWSTLMQQADELSNSFKLIWIPNAAKAATNPSMGYDPVYWFSNYNSSFGTETELRSMISTFKQRGTGIIADVVVNHRSGMTNWTNFPAERWNGKIYKLGPEHICSTDEVRFQSDQEKPTGAPDTGEDFSGARDLDHTSAKVQEHVSDYCRFLLEEMGYVGFRLDMVKGYAPKYTKMYNEASKPTYSVGECFDGNYDVVTAWIDGTGKQSAAFDFPLKFALNEAFSSNDMSKLCWLANGVTPQPAGLIHYGYQQYAVTFVDNHDTYRDNNKFNGNVPAANAFILCSPGTPCIFLPHWQSYKAQLKPIIEARNAAGVHNQSTVKVLRHDKDCYMAEITGTKGKLAVRIGSSTAVPSGYTDSNIKAKGNGYCVWSTTDGGNDDPIIQNPINNNCTVYYDNSATKWVSPHIHYWGNEESIWPGMKMAKESENIWKYTLPAGTTGIVFNSGDGSQSSDLLPIANHLYDLTGDKGEYKEGTITHDFPADIYVIGNLKSGNWNTKSAAKATGNKSGIYTWSEIEILAADNDTKGYFSFLTTTGNSWDEVNTSDRYGALEYNCPVLNEAPVKVRLFQANVNASSAYSWSVTPGNYNIQLNLADMTLNLSKSSVVENIVKDASKPIYFNLLGQKVDNPSNGIYIEVRGNISKKIIIP